MPLTREMETFLFVLGIVSGCVSIVITAVVATRFWLKEYRKQRQRDNKDEEVKKRRQFDAVGQSGNRSEDLRKTCSVDGHDDTSGSNVGHTNKSLYCADKIKTSNSLLMMDSDNDDLSTILEEPSTPSSTRQSSVGSGSPFRNQNSVHSGVNGDVDDAGYGCRAFGLTAFAPGKSDGIPEPGISCKKASVKKFSLSVFLSNVVQSSSKSADVKKNQIDISAHDDDAAMLAKWRQRASKERDSLEAALGT